MSLQQSTKRHAFLEEIGRIARKAVCSFVRERLPILNLTLVKAGKRSGQKPDLGNLSNVAEKTERIIWDIEVQ